MLGAVEGHRVFDAADKHLKPDLEAACPLDDGSVLLLGSGSSPRRTRAALLTPRGVASADLAGLYARAGETLGVGPDRLNLEGACVVDGRLRWFLRGSPAAGVPSASVDVDLDALGPGGGRRRRRRSRRRRWSCCSGWTSAGAPLPVRRRTRQHPPRDDGPQPVPHVPRHGG